MKCRYAAKPLTTRHTSSYKHQPWFCRNRFDPLPAGLAAARASRRALGGVHGRLGIPVGVVLKLEREALAMACALYSKAVQGPVPTTHGEEYSFQYHEKNTVRL